MDSLYGADQGTVKLDEEFDKFLVDMKPYVLTLPHKSDRQRCALWIKKLCEPPTGITGRKNRNMHCQMMLHMLRRGSLDGPFARKPERGPLSTLTPNSSIYFDEPSFGASKKSGIPDWVTGELALGDTTGSSMLKSSTVSSYDPSSFTASSWRSSPNKTDISISPKLRRPHSSIALGMDRDPFSLSPKGILGSKKDHRPFSLDDMSIGKLPDDKPAVTFMTDDLDLDLPKSITKSDEESKDKNALSATAISSVTDDLSDWSRPLQTSEVSDSLSVRSSGLSGLKEDRLVFPSKSTEREVEVKTKMLEAKFHEEKLRLQQKHDTAVQKILDRKNAEIEEVKSHYRQKAKEMEECVTKLDKKVSSQQKESQAAVESKDKQISELRKALQESVESKKNEYEKRLHNILANFEQEKLEMQRQHTKNIQEILDDTNARLARMEEEYSQQTLSTTEVIRELESRLQQLTMEAESTAQSKSALERDKIEKQSMVERLTTDLEELKARCFELEQKLSRREEEHEQELRVLHNKTDATVEFLKQEQNIAAAKAADTISDLEQHMDHLKRSLKDSEDQRQRQIRESEQVYQQDKLHVENLHDKQVRSLKRELEHLELDSQKKIKRLEQIIKDKDDEIKQMKEQNKVQALQAERALEDFKTQVEKNQSRVYDEMKLQMERVEADLNRSKQLREKQAAEFVTQTEEWKQQHEREVTELKVSFEQEKSRLLHESHAQKELIQGELERELEGLKSSQALQVKELEERVRETHRQDTKIINDLEKQCRDQREELVQCNQLRKQQLVELGLLREEEKQKMQRDQEAQLARLRTEMEQQKLELQKTHSAEMEKTLDKANGRLKDIEREYTERAQKSTQTISELQGTIQQLRDEMKKHRETAERRVFDLNVRQEEEKKAIRKQHNTTIDALQQELERQCARARTADKKLEQREIDHEQKMTELKIQYEERMHGLMPASVRQELENTISSLRSQVQSIQQRASILQDELEMRTSVTPSVSFTHTPIKT
ncbi:centrosomal protein of 112 kDa-like [Liolophura sinensis]|uniref:centrosomal protein of 112 kDa-like n=1 Tax=Liolophura sinensis TaxID=3198878 RepID=UPI0031583101